MPVKTQESEGLKWETIEEDSDEKPPEKGYHAVGVPLKEVP